MQVNKKGFTLVELLVVIAIIGALTSVVLSALASSRSRGSDAAIKTILSHLRSGVEMASYDLDGKYNTGAAIYTNACGAVGAGTSVLSNLIVQQGIDDAISKNGGVEATCMADTSHFVIVVPLRTNSGNGWCIDNGGTSVQINNYAATFLDTADTSCALAAS